MLEGMHDVAAAGTSTVEVATAVLELMVDVEKDVIVGAAGVTVLAAFAVMVEVTESRYGSRGS